MTRPELNPSLLKDGDHDAGQSGKVGIISESELRRLTIRWVLRGMTILLIAVALFLAIAFLPGSFEGNYRGKLAPTCGCDSRNFLSFRSEKMVWYSTDHPPADLFGRYQKSADGSIEVFLVTFDAGKKDELLFRAYSRFLITKFVSVPEGNVDWCWKWPLFGETRKAFENHEIKSIGRNNDIIETKYYDKDFRVVRTETKPAKKRIPEVSSETNPPKSN